MFPGRQARKAPQDPGEGPAQHPRVTRKKSKTCRSPAGRARDLDRPIRRRDFLLWRALALSRRDYERQKPPFVCPYRWGVIRAEPFFPYRFRASNIDRRIVSRPSALRRVPNAFAGTCARAGSSIRTQSRSSPHPARIGPGYGVPRPIVVRRPPQTMRRSCSSPDATPSRRLYDKRSCHKEALAVCKTRLRPFPGAAAANGGNRITTRTAASPRRPWTRFYSRARPRPCA